MTVIVRKAQFQAIIGAGDPGGNQDIVIPGFGTVAAAVFALTKATVNTGQPSAPDSGYSVGYTDMTNTCSFSYFEEDNRAGSNTLRRSSNDSVIGVLDEIGIESIAELVGPVTDGLRIRWSDNLDAQYYFSVTLWGGVQAACGDWTQPAGDGATFKITLPFEIDVMYIAGTGNPINNLAAGNAQLTEGIIVNDRPGISQTAYCQSSEDSKAQTRLAGGMYQNLSAINHRLNSTLISRASFANLIESDGVTMETSTIGVDDFSNELGYLAIGLNGEAQAHLLTTQTPDVTGLETYTQPGFKPQYLDGVYTITNFIDASRIDNNVSVRSRRFVDENGETTQNFSSQDNSTTTIAKSLAHNAQLYISQPSGGNSLIEATFSEFNANGWVDNYTKDASRYFFILAIEEAQAPTTVELNLSITEDADILASDITNRDFLDLSVNEDPDILSSTLELLDRVLLELSINEDPDAITSDLIIADYLSLSISEDPDILSATLTVTDEVLLDLSVTADNDTLSSTITIADYLNLSAAEQPDSLSSLITLIDDLIIDLSALEDNDTLSSQIGLLLELSSNIAEQNDVITALVTVTDDVLLDVAINEDDDVLTSSMRITLGIDASISEDQDILTSSVTVIDDTILDATIVEDNDGLASAVVMSDRLNLFNVDAPDTLMSTVQVTDELFIDLNTIDDNDTLQSNIGTTIIIGAIRAIFLAKHIQASYQTKQMQVTFRKK